jgi:hypothetical protein
MDSIVRALDAIDEKWDLFQKDYLGNVQKELCDQVKGALSGFDAVRADPFKMSRKSRSSRVFTADMSRDPSAAWDDDGDLSEDVSTAAGSSHSGNSSSSSTAAPMMEPKPAVLAKSAPPQELLFVAPQDAKPGMPLCLAGPHGDPIWVPAPEGVQPGKPCSVWLGPTSSFTVLVPEDAEQGAQIAFETENGEMLHTVVPPGKKPWDTFQICPPVMMLQVPHGVASGDEVFYQTPAGSHAAVRVPAGFNPGMYFPCLLPAPEKILEIAARQNKNPSGALVRMATTLPMSSSSSLKQQDARSHDLLGGHTPLAHKQQAERSDGAIPPGLFSLDDVLAEEERTRLSEAVSEAMELKQASTSSRPGSADDAVSPSAWREGAGRCIMDLDAENLALDPKENSSLGDFRMLPADAMEKMYEAFKACRGSI